MSKISNSDIAMQMSDPLLQRAFPSGARDTTINMVEVGPSFGGILPQEGVDDTGEVEDTVSGGGQLEGIHLLEGSLVVENMGPGLLMEDIQVLEDLEAQVDSGALEDILVVEQEDSLKLEEGIR